jgi:ectoine hydroxylase-related dioxygenase (phytanoyl-CoA dioxygenase family)
MLGATTYLYDVQPGGGGFVLWPRSHHKVWEYFRTHPQHIDGSFQDNDGQNLPWSFMLKKANVPPKEYCSRAGSVIFWHSFLIHAGSKNFRQWPRIAIFERWSHHRIHKIKYDIPDNLWKYWMIS